MNEITKKDNGVERTPTTNETIRKYLCPEANDAQLTLFCELCKAQNLNPFTREAYLVVYKTRSGESKTNMIVSKDVFLKRANEQKSYKGFKAGVILSRDNEIHYQEGSFKLKSDVLLGGWAEVYKEGYSTPIRQEVSMEEYSSGQSTWSKMPLTMIRKVALVHALREAFPEAFQGMYDESERFVMESGPKKYNRPPIEQPKRKSDDYNSKNIDKLIEQNNLKKKEVKEGALSNPFKDIVEVNSDVKKPHCVKCSVEVTPAVEKYSVSKFGESTCFECQKEIKEYK